MALLKCKVCGGQLDVIDGVTICECKYCGTRQTVPHLDSDEVNERYNLGNYERMNCNFDTAFSIYSDLAISSRGQEPEAYWNTMLCRFGIIYQQDTKTKEAIPTLNKTQLNSVYDDPGYQKAIEYADPDARQYYEEQAQKIENVRKRYLDVINHEEPYDVFICFKETDDNQQRTRDSIEAQNLYEYLTKEGYKVFFSRVTLMDLAGVDYEPYIYAALNSAKVMFVFGSKEKYVDAPWVRNEWSRYLSVVRNDFSKLLIPVYSEKPDYFPNELKNLQGYNMDSPGWYQDAKVRVDRVVGSKVQKTETTAYSGTAEQLVSNAQTYGKLGDRDKELQLYTEMTEKYPSDYRGWWGMLSSKTTDFSNYIIFKHNKNDLVKLFKNAYTVADQNKRKELQDIWTDYLRQLSSIDNAGSISRNLISYYENRIEGANKKIESLREENSVKESRIRDIYASRDNGEGQPIKTVDDDIKEQKSKITPRIIPIALIILSILYALAAYNAYQTQDTGWGIITCIPAAIIGFVCASFGGAIVGIIIQAIAISYWNLQIVIFFILASIVLIFLVSTYDSSEKAKTKIKEIESRREEEEQQQKEWYDSFDIKVNGIRQDIEANDSKISKLNEAIDMWREWGWQKKDDQFIPRDSQFVNMAFQTSIRDSGLPYELDEFCKKHESLEENYPL